MNHSGSSWEVQCCRFPLFRWKNLDVAELDRGKLNCRCGNSTFAFCIVPMPLAFWFHPSRCPCFNKWLISRSDRGAFFWARLICLFAPSKRSASDPVGLDVGKNRRKLSETIKSGRRLAPLPINLGGLIINATEI